MQLLQLSALLSQLPVPLPRQLLPDLLPRQLLPVPALSHGLHQLLQPHALPAGWLQAQTLLTCIAVSLPLDRHTLPQCPVIYSAIVCCHALCVYQGQSASSGLHPTTFFTLSLPYQIKGTQDKVFSYSFSDSLTTLLLPYFLTLSLSHYFVLLLCSYLTASLPHRVTVILSLCRTASLTGCLTGDLSTSDQPGVQPGVQPGDQLTDLARKPGDSKAAGPIELKTAALTSLAIQSKPTRKLKTCKRVDIAPREVTSLGWLRGAWAVYLVCTWCLFCVLAGCIVAVCTLECSDSCAADAE